MTTKMLPFNVIREDGKIPRFRPAQPQYSPGLFDVAVETELNQAVWPYNKAFNIVVDESNSAHPPVISRIYYRCGQMGGVLSYFQVAQCLSSVAESTSAETKAAEIKPYAEIALEVKPYAELFSSPAHMREQIGYELLVEHAKNNLPYIQSTFMQSPIMWMHVLMDAFRFNPVPLELRIHVPSCAVIWLEWLKNQIEEKGG